MRKCGVGQDKHRAEVVAFPIFVAAFDRAFDIRQAMPLDSRATTSPATEVAWIGLFPLSWPIRGGNRTVLGLARSAAAWSECTLAL